MGESIRRHFDDNIVSALENRLIAPQDKRAFCAGKHNSDFLRERTRLVGAYPKHLQEQDI